MTVEWFVANVPFRCTQEQVSDFLKQAGVLVSRVRMIKEFETRRFRGFCFADVFIRGGEADEENARAAVFGQMLTEPPFTDDEWAAEHARNPRRDRTALESRPVHVEPSSKQRPRPSERFSDERRFG